MRYPGRALDLHSCKHFYSPSAMKVIYVSGSEKESHHGYLRLCLWAIAYGNNPEGTQAQKAKSCTFSHRTVVLSLHELSSHSGISISEAAPSVDKCAWESVF